MKIKNIFIIILFNIIPVIVITLTLNYNYNLTKEINYTEHNLQKILENTSLLKKETSLNTSQDELLKYINNIDNIDEELNKLTIKLNDIFNTQQKIYKKNKDNEKTLIALKNENDTLTAKYQALSSHKIENIITINQYPKYPNGCEPIALTILLKYYQVDVDAESVMNALPKGEIPHYENGIFYGGNPNYEFLGDPRSYSGWGIWDKGLEITANKFKSPIINGTGMDFSSIIKLIKENRPVIVWTSINLKSPYIAATWTYKKTGEIITWRNYNHAVVVIGYTDNEIIISDPINGQIRYMNKQKFINVYNYMGKRALYY